MNDELEGIRVQFIRIFLKGLAPASTKNTSPKESLAPKTLNKLGLHNPPPPVQTFRTLPGIVFSM